MLVPSSIVNLVQPWSDFYSHSKLTETIVTFLHVGGLLLAGGFALSADRGTFRALALPAEERSHQLAELHAVHRWVVPGLVVIIISGVLLLTADIESFLGSWIYWTKMGLVLLLLLNGYRMTRVEKALAADASAEAPGWHTLRAAARASVVLWVTITFAGLALVNYA